VAEISTEIVIQSAVSGSLSVPNSVTFLWTNIIPILQIRRSDVIPLGGTEQQILDMQRHSPVQNFLSNNTGLQTNRSTIHTSLHCDCRLYWSNRTITTPTLI